MGIHFIPSNTYTYKIKTVTGCVQNMTPFHYLARAVVIEHEYILLAHEKVFHTPFFQVVTLSSVKVL